MPELPEVQTIVSDLDKRLRNHTIKKIWTDWQKSFHPSYEKVKRGVIGKKILRVRRRAKNILIDFTGDRTMLIHLKMTGHLLYRSNDWQKSESNDSPFFDSFNQFIRTCFYLDDKKQLAFSDVRRFGEIKLFKTSEEDSILRLKMLGPEPLSRKFTRSVFVERIETKKGLIKSVLLDQHVLSGIGNIYADEILWEARINPKQSVAVLTGKEITALYGAIVKILKKAVKYRGTSISDYRDALGRKGGYQNVRKVYQRAGEQCYRCKTILARTKVNNRGTTFCPSCQKQHAK